MCVWVCVCLFPWFTVAVAALVAVAMTRAQQHDIQRVDNVLVMRRDTRQVDPNPPPSSACRCPCARCERGARLSVSGVCVSSCVGCVYCDSTRQHAPSRPRNGPRTRVRINTKKHKQHQASHTTHHHQHITQQSVCIRVIVVDRVTINRTASPNRGRTAARAHVKRSQRVGRGRRSDSSPNPAASAGRGMPVVGVEPKRRPNPGP